MKKRVLFVCFYLSFLYSQNIKVYALFTDSHKQLVNDWFIPTLPNDCDLIIKEFPQECLNGEYYQVGWKKTMIRKVKFIISAIKENWGGEFVFSDVDIQFFSSFKKWMKDNFNNQDFLIQRQSPAKRVCTGFFITKCNERVLSLWKKVLEQVELFEKTDEETQLNHILLNKDHHKDLTWDFLPREEFFNGGIFTGKRWNEGGNLYIPKNIILHHANWTVGAHNKIKQMEYVRKIVNEY